MKWVGKKYKNNKKVKVLQIKGIFSKNINNLPNVESINAVCNGMTEKIFYYSY